MNEPFISILIAARNEEENILNLLYSLEALDYPKDKLQILLGDDNSEDTTAKIIQEFIINNAHYQLVTIKNNINNLRGKANVLAQLAHYAKGDFFFFTDADIELPKTWIREMLPYFDTKNRVGVVTGATAINYQNWFEACQAIEWLNALCIFKILEKYNFPVTAMGNNMAVSAEAYWAVGGYEKIGFSIVEDYALFKAILEKKYSFRQVFTEKILAKTQAPKDLITYFYQRKRWFVGAFNAHFLLIIPAFIQALFLPILLIISLFSWKIALLIFGIIGVLQTFFSFKTLREINQYKLCNYLLMYNLYMFFLPFCQLIFYFLPIKTSWKGRKY